MDRETGMYYYGARYYDPRISIFVSVDPLAEQTMEPYLYTGNNPIMFTDPTGMSKVDPPVVKKILSQKTVGNLRGVSVSSDFRFIPPSSSNSSGRSTTITSTTQKSSTLFVMLDIPTFEPTVSVSETTIKQSGVYYDSSGNKTNNIANASSFVLNENITTTDYNLYSDAAETREFTSVQEFNVIKSNNKFNLEYKDGNTNVTTKKGEVSNQLRGIINNLKKENSSKLDMFKNGIQNQMYNSSAENEYNDMIRESNVDSRARVRMYEKKQ